MKNRNSSPEKTILSGEIFVPFLVGTILLFRTGPLKLSLLHLKANSAEGESGGLHANSEETVTVALCWSFSPCKAYNSMVKDREQLGFN